MMAIQESVVVELATVEVNDDYRVEVRQIRKLVDYSAEQAEALAEELIVAAERARAVLAEHQAEVASRARAGSPLHVGGEVVL